MYFSSLSVLSVAQKIHQHKVCINPRGGSLTVHYFEKHKLLIRNLSSGNIIYTALIYSPLCVFLYEPQSY